MAQSLTNFDAMLKEFYEGALREQLNNEIKLFQALNKDGRAWSGRRVVFPVHLSRNVGVGARSESSALPSAGNQTTQQSNITASYNYGRIDITGPVMASGKHAFAEALAFELEGIKDDVAYDLGRQSYGDGLGVLAQVAADSASSSQVTVYNKFAEPGQPGGRYIQIGQGLSFGSQAAVSAGGTASVISVAISTNSGTTTDTITISATGYDISNTYFVFNEGAGGDGVEMKGLRALIDDVTESNIYGQSQGFYTASVQSISRATYKKWNAFVLNNSQVERAIDSSLVQKAFDNIKRGSGKDVNKIIGEYDVVSAFLDAVSSDRRYNTNSFDAGRSELSYNGVSLIQDKLAPYNELYLMGMDCLKAFVLKDFSFADSDGAILKNVTGYDRWEAFLQYYGNIGIEIPNGCAVIRDIKTIR